MWTSQSPLALGRESAGGAFVMTRGFSPAVVPPGDVSDAWSPGPFMPIAAEDVYSTTSIGCDLHVTGGTVGGGLNVATVEEFDPVLGLWAAAAPLPAPASEFAAGAVSLPASSTPGVIEAVGTGIAGAAGTQSSLLACA